MNADMKRYLKLEVTSMELAKMKATLAILGGDAPTKEAQNHIKEAFNAIDNALTLCEIEKFKIDS